MIDKLKTKGGPGGVCRAQVVVGSSLRLDQARAGFRRFSLRGLAKARCEWDLVCLALNVKRLHVLKPA